MLLLMVNEWLGPGNNMPPDIRFKTQSRNNLRSFHTSLPLQQALDRLHQHQEAYNTHYLMAVNFTLLAVSEIPMVPEQTLENLRAEPIAKLPITVSQFRER